MGYRRLQLVTGSYEEIEGITGRLQGVTGDYRSYKALRRV